MVEPPARRYDIQEVERSILEHWEEHRCFQRSMEDRRGSDPFIFLEGPPTANGLPGIHHVLARTFKDLVCRYKTMRGYLVERKGGWDTHGLPVELEVEKELGISSKDEIEEFGVAEFNARCRKSVFRYEKEWRRLTERMAFWIDMDDPYITLKNDYIESIWWSLKKTWERDLLYKGYRITPYCPRCGTPLSSHEVALGYRNIVEPSLTVKLRIKGSGNEYLLAWTTTPWTLPGNVALAVGPNIEYVKVRQENDHGEEEFYWLARDCAKEKDREEQGVLRGDFEVVESLIGMQMEGWEYEPLFEAIPQEVMEGRRAFFVTTADFVKTEADDSEDHARQLAVETGTIDEEKAREGKFAGTGIVHTAVMYGEDDYQLGTEIGLPAYHTVGPDGRFRDTVEKFAGVFVKDADSAIIEDLRTRGLLYDAFEYGHSYPFCWRCETPLLYYARDSWYIAMSQIRDRVQEHNSRVDWYPEHIGRARGRFGNFLQELKDWALSRERYWGTPLPIWSCTSEDCDHRECLGSSEEIKERSGLDLEDYHRPYIDQVEYECRECGSTMKREPYLIDVWYDSGASFFSQWHYPFENYDTFHDNFPVDFISEGIDQTRGWFYSLLAIASLTQDDLCYRNCVSTGHVLDKEGQKMSKSKGNVVDPWSIFDEEGADALRYYMVSVNAPWAPKKFDRRAVTEVVKKFLNTFWNSFAFYAQYASLDDFDYRSQVMDVAQRTPLDKWLLSRMATTVREVTEHMDGYVFHKAARALESFVMDDLSNWYIRRSRKRFWGEEMTDDKRCGYSTLRECLGTVARMAAPVTPFISEKVFLGLTEGEAGPASVHLTDWPVFDEDMVDEALETAMANCIELAEVGRRLRATAGDGGIKTRQPLPRAIVVPKGEFSISGLEDILKEELNIKEVELAEDLDRFQAVTVKPNHKAIGPRFKSRAPAVVEALEALDPEEAFSMLQDGSLAVDIEGEAVELDREEVVVERKASGPYQVQETGDFALVLDTTLDATLRAEGMARELNRRIQQSRKELGLDVEQGIRVTISCPEDLARSLEDWTDYLKTETRATALELGEVEVKGDKVVEATLDGTVVRVGIEPE